MNGGDIYRVEYRLIGVVPSLLAIHRAVISGARYEVHHSQELGNQSMNSTASVVVTLFFLSLTENLSRCK